MKPAVRRCREEFLERDALRAHEERPRIGVPRRKRLETGQRLLPPSARDLDRDERSIRDDVVDLPVSVAPVENLGTGGEQVRARRRLDKPAPDGRVRARLRERHPYNGGR